MYIGHSAQLSGAELGLAKLLPLLEGIEPRVILAEDGPLVERLRRSGIPVTVLPMAVRARTIRRSDSMVSWTRSLRELFRYVALVWREIRVQDPAVVHTVSLKAAVYGGLAARLARKTLVWSLRDRVSSDYLSRGGLLLVRLIARLPDVVIANSHSTAETIKPWARHVCVVWPVAFDNAPRSEPRRSRDALRVAMVGRIARWKGQDVFLRAFAGAFPDGLETAVIAGVPLFGEFEYEDELHRLVNTLGLEGRVEFAGFVEDVFDLLAKVDVLVHASTIPEPFGQVVVQGFAAGLPVVASDAGGPAEIARRDVDTLLVPPSDVRALSRALRRLADDDELRLRLGTNGHARLSEFNPEAIARQTRAVYLSVTARSRDRAQR